jgi:hypothetical protein
VEDAQKALESAIEAAEQLAIYYEHRVKQPGRALDLMRSTIAELRHAQRKSKISRDCAGKIEARLAHRLTRLERRCASLFARAASRERQSPDWLLP